MKESTPHARKWERREFVSTIAAGLGSAALLSLPLGALAGEGPAPLTIRQVIDLIIKNIPGSPLPQTVDTVKSGNADQPVTGIVTTMFATLEVIQRAAGLGANFIIAHEPTFYNHQDETAWLGNDEVFRVKRDLLQKNKMVIWRFHDYIHMLRPDGVLMGVLTALGWEKYYDAANPNVIKMPPTALQQIIQLCKRKLDIEHLKYIGNQSQLCSKVLLMPGAAGGTRQIDNLRKEKPDVLICGELNEWETSEYIRDWRYSGSGTSLVVLGHVASEEPGLEWMVKWLTPQIPASIKITHLPSKDAFRWA